MFLIHFPSPRRWLRILAPQRQTCELCKRRASALYNPFVGLFVCDMTSCPNRSLIYPCTWTDEQKAKLVDLIKPRHLDLPRYALEKAIYDEETGEQVGPLFTISQLQPLMVPSAPQQDDNDVSLGTLKAAVPRWDLPTIFEILQMYLVALNNWDEDYPKMTPVNAMLVARAMIMGKDQANYYADEE